MIGADFGTRIADSVVSVLGLSMWSAVFVRWQWLMLTMVVFVPLSAASPAQAPAAPQANVATLAPSTAGDAPLQLRVVDRVAFCSRMRQAFAHYASSNGYDAVQQNLLATNATVGLVEEFKLGRAADYVSAASLSAYSRVPHRGAADSYLPVSNFVGLALGVGNNVTLALSVGELRFIPYAQKNLALVVIAQNAASLTPERAKKVAEVAQQAGIKINVLWVGSSHEDGQAINEARSLAWLTSVTGGYFANLSGHENPCQSST